MSDMHSPANLIREARIGAGLSQEELAARCNTSQPAIARLESGTANTTVSTLVRCAAAAGYAIRIELVPLSSPDAVIERYKVDVDRASLRANQRHSVEQRLKTLGEWQLSLRALAQSTRAARKSR